VALDELPRAIPDQPSDKPTPLRSNHITHGHRRICIEQRSHVWKYALTSATPLLLQIRQMSDPTSSRALSPLGLPSAALHHHAYAEPHPDSEDAVRYERQRFAKELVPIHRERVAEANEAHATPSFASLRSRNTSLRSSSHGSRDDLRRRTSNMDGVSTQIDVHEDRSDGEEVGWTERWYDPVISFWTTHISLSIDEGAHRDHLGTSLFLSFLRQSNR